MRVDIFPAINAPQIYVVNNYAGMDPSQIEGIITNVYEQNFQYVDGLKGVESKNIQNLVLLKLTFYPGTDMAAAMSQVVSLSNRARGQMPPSVLPPFVMRFDAANVPIGYLVLESKTRPLGELADLGLYRIRPLLIARFPARSRFRRSAATPGRSSSRSIPTACGPTTSRPKTWSRRLGTGNVVAPSGNLYMPGQMPLVPTNAMVADPQEMGNIPIQPGKNVYIRDVATIQDTTDINYGCALVNGRKSIYIPVVKKDTASTLTVVQQIHESMPLFQSVVPEDVSVRYEFDESPTVRAAIKSVATEGVIGAVLTGLMILIFLARRAHRDRGAGEHPLLVDRSPWSACGLRATRSTSCRWAAWRWPSASSSTRRSSPSRTPMRRCGTRTRWPGRRGGATRPRPRPGCWPCSASSRCSFPRFIMQRAGPLAVHAADARGGLCHDRLLPAVQHARAGALRLADAAPGRSSAAEKGFFERILPRLQRIVEA